MNVSGAVYKLTYAMPLLLLSRHQKPQQPSRHGFQSHSRETSRISPAHPAPGTKGFSVQDSLGSRHRICNSEASQARRWGQNNQYRIQRWAPIRTHHWRLYIVLQQVEDWAPASVSNSQEYQSCLTTLLLWIHKSRSIQRRLHRPPIAVDWYQLSKYRKWGAP